MERVGAGRAANASGPKAHNGALTMEEMSWQTWRRVQDGQSSWTDAYTGKGTALPGLCVGDCVNRFEQD